MRYLLSNCFQFVAFAYSLQIVWNAMQCNALSQGPLWSARLSNSCQLVMIKIFVMAEVLLKIVRRQIEILGEQLTGIFILDAGR